LPVVFFFPLCSPRLVNVASVTQVLLMKQLQPGSSICGATPPAKADKCLCLSFFFLLLTAFAWRKNGETYWPHLSFTESLTKRRVMGCQGGEMVAGSAEHHWQRWPVRGHCSARGRCRGWCQLGKGPWSPAGPSEDAVLPGVHVRQLSVGWGAALAVPRACERGAQSTRWLFLPCLSQRNSHLLTHLQCRARKCWQWAGGTGWQSCGTSQLLWWLFWRFFWPFFWRVVVGAGGCWGGWLLGWVVVGAGGCSGGCSGGGCSGSWLFWCLFWRWWFWWLVVLVAVLAMTVFVVGCSSGWWFWRWWFWRWVVLAVGCSGSSSGGCSDSCSSGGCSGGWLFWQLVVLVLILAVVVLVGCSGACSGSWWFWQWVILVVGCSGSSSWWLFWQPFWWWFWRWLFWWLFWRWLFWQLVVLTVSCSGGSSGGWLFWQVAVLAGGCSGDCSGGYSGGLSPAQRLASLPLAKWLLWFVRLCARCKPVPGAFRFSSVVASCPVINAEGMFWESRAGWLV